MGQGTDIGLDGHSADAMAAAPAVIEVGDIDAALAGIEAADGVISRVIFVPR